MRPRIKPVAWLALAAAIGFLQPAPELSATSVTNGLVAHLKFDGNLLDATTNQINGTSVSLGTVGTNGVTFARAARPGGAYPRHERRHDQRLRVAGLSRPVALRQRCHRRYHRLLRRPVAQGLVIERRRAADLRIRTGTAAAILAGLSRMKATERGSTSKTTSTPERTKWAMQDLSWKTRTGII